MPLTVLSDADVHGLLISLNKDDIAELQHNLADALHDYSTGTQETTAGCSLNQPQRMAIPGPDSSLTLFMPASTSTSRGMKIVSVATAPIPSPIPSMASIGLSSHSRSSSRNASPRRGTSRSGSPAPSSPSVASTISTVPSLPHISSTTSATSIAPSTDLSVTSPQSTTPRGSLTLLTTAGMPYAFIAAEELTAFRTALAATMIFHRRTNIHTLTVFGAGKQAEWHIRLALILRPGEVHHVDIVNRSFMRAKRIMHDYHVSPEWEDIRLANPNLRFSIVSPASSEYQRLLKEHVRKADVIFCCTPSITPLFPHEHLTNPGGRSKGRLVSAIGSYRPHMVELHPEILRQAVSPDHKHHHHKHADKGGIIVVDSLEACLKEAGEVIQAGIDPEKLVEMGELLMVKKASMREIEMGTGEGEKGLRDWLMKGNVIYKSVGIGLMDICVGEDLVRLARGKGIGTYVDSF